MADVKGAGDTDMRENPTVHSKGTKWHGQPHAPGKVTFPGKTAPISGSSSGHASPRDVQFPKETHKVTRQVSGGFGNQVTSPAQRQGSGKLDSGGYVGGNRGKGPSSK